MEMYKLRGKRNVEIYETLEEYVGDISRKISPNVRLENVENLFLFFGGLLMLILLVFVIDFSVQTNTNNQR